MKCKRDHRLRRIQVSDFWRRFMSTGVDGLHTIKQMVKNGLAIIS